MLTRPRSDRETARILESPAAASIPSSGDGLDCLRYMQPSPPLPGRQSEACMLPGLLQKSPVSPFPFMKLHGVSGDLPCLATGSVYGIFRI